MKDNKLTILWTNDNPLTAEHMVFLYMRHVVTNNRFDDVTLIIWGATTKLTAENPHIQELVKEAQDNGVRVSACITCAEALGVKDDIENLGIELIKWGAPLTELIKNEEHLLTI